MPLPHIVHTKSVLSNGLTVISHEDCKAPIVAVNVWYHVGSKDEPAGRSGFAHLFEHLMFNGSEHFNDDYFQAMERAGATEINGTTNRDRTNYFQNVPTAALELALWMESDRMGHLLGAIDQAKLDEQRRVVKNEKRQGEDRPYGRVHEILVRATYPKGHPYDHTVIGSMEDLDAATVEDVHSWFETFYGPNNAVLVIAGDIGADQAHTLADRYFGDIAPGPPLSKFHSWVAKRRGLQRESLQDRVPEARVYKVWNVPATYTEDYRRLQVAAAVLARGMNSRLYKRLVYEDRLATGVNASLSPGEIGSQFVVAATAHPGKDLTTIEAVLDEELSRLLEYGPTMEELQRVAAGYEATLVRRMERIGGFGGKSAILAQGETFRSDPEAFVTEFRARQSVTTDEVKDAACQWLADGEFVLEVKPLAPLVAKPSKVQRHRPPAVHAPRGASFPVVHRATLSGGIPLLLVERRETPIVEISLLFDAGYAADHYGITGTASLTSQLFSLGTASVGALEISDRLTRLGASITSGSNLDGSTACLSALKAHLEPSLDLFSDIVLHAAFAKEEFDRVRKEQLARIQAEKSSPSAMALRAFPKLLYGEDHAYSLPLTGSGSEDSVAQITREDVAAFHRTWLNPLAATIVVVGDVGISRAVRLLEDRLGDVQGFQSAPAKNIGTASHRNSPALYVVDRPGSAQSIVFAGHLAPPHNAPNNLAIETMNLILGGTFTSRINMNLREDKGWCYGASSTVVPARGQRPFVVFAPVQADKTGDTIREIQQELRGIQTDAPPTAKEVLKAQESLTRALAGRWETCAAVEDALISMVQYALPNDYYDSLAGRLLALDAEDIYEAAQEVIQPERLIWVVVGDLASIETELQGLGFPSITLIDADGNPRDSR